MTLKSPSNNEAEKRFSVVDRPIPEVGLAPIQLFSYVIEVILNTHPAIFALNGNILKPVELTEHIKASLNGLRFLINQPAAILLQIYPQDAEQDLLQLASDDLVFQALRREHNIIDVIFQILSPILEISYLAHYSDPLHEALQHLHKDQFDLIGL